MSWLFSQALVEEYSPENYSDGEPSVPSSGKHINQAHLSQDRMMEFSRLSQYGMTYKPLTESRGEELLTSYLGAFPVRILVQQDEAQELKENAQECGGTWRELLAK